MVEKSDNFGLSLQVAEALQLDVGHSIARIPSKIMYQLDLSEGDVVQIQAADKKEKAVALVKRAQSQDESLDIIRVDGSTRFNAGISLGEFVLLKKVVVNPAQSITLAPRQNVVFKDDPSHFFRHKLLGKPLRKNQSIIIHAMNTQWQFVVTKLSPGKVAIVNKNTKIIVSDQASSDAHKIPEVSYEDIGGLQEEIEKVREMVELPMKHPEVFERLGITPPKGVLLTGPPGTGKTLLAKAVASETDSHFLVINGPEIMSKFYGESEKKLREIFEEAEKNSPAIIFIDEIDSIAPKRGEGRDQTEKRVVAQLLTAMDGTRERGNVVVMAATNRPDDIDEALRRPGRFDREIKIMPPNEDGRREILQIHSRGMPLDKSVNLNVIASKTHGFTGADLQMLCKEAGIKALKPYMPSLKEYSIKVPTNILETIVLKQQDFVEAMKMVEPSALRDVMIKKPKIHWDDIGGLTKAKELLAEAIELPLKEPELFSKAGVKPPKGILLFGPPGTGKTLLAKAVATEADANFISVKCPELISKWVGESEKKIREIFQKARQVAPAVIFFDEFDSMSQARGSSMTDATERMVNQLLTEIDGIENLEQVTVIAATNRADLIDPALIRPGRIDLKVEVTLPDEVGREQIFAVHTKSMPLVKGVEKYIKDTLIAKTAGFSGAEIQALCREAGLEAIREAQKRGHKEPVVTKKNFSQSLKTVLEMEKKDIATTNITG